MYDYKTGRTDKYYEKVATPSDKYPNGGAYWRQMVFYDLLLKKDPRIAKHITQGTIQALEPDKEGKFVERHITVSEDDREFVTNLITQTYEKIRRMEFTEFCGECEWCRMNDLTVPVERGEDSAES